MVLSNKKLKQKLRAAVAESLAASVGGNNSLNVDSSDPEPNSQIQSLKGLLGSATQKPRLSKREKRRAAQTLASQSSETRSSSGRDAGEEKKEADSEGVIEKKRKKKRKRDADGVKETENAVNGSAENVAATKKKKKKKKKKKNKKKNKDEEQNKGSGATKGGSEEQGVKEAIKISDSQENGDAATKVYVGGIPYYSTEDDIRSYFEGCGTITEVDCMQFPETGKFRGIAIISFKTEAAAKRALALDGADMGGLYLKIQPYKTTRLKKMSDFAPEMVEGYNRIYVGNLSWDITEDDLKKLFSSCSISSIRFGMDKETGEFRGYAHVDFSDNLSLTMALKLDQEIVCGRPVMIRCAVPNKSAETHSRSAPTSKKAAADSGGGGGGETSTGSGKKKRRTCYGCGVKGHLFSACPNKQAPNAS
ncbi:phragmoplastin interacting protein 1 [Malania oleifera]|uniref:phragmoplastin interacting protein 1 n=1 Tax=Malania oleifera TaxID=397392 RepID=UPI0025AEA3AD|nr:phragmoplastin interacting protein 1 [Malania oleifera]